MYSFALRTVLFTQNMNHHITNEEAQTLKISKSLKQGFHWLMESNLKPGPTRDANPLFFEYPTNIQAPGYIPKAGFYEQILKEVLMAHWLNSTMQSLEMRRQSTNTFSSACQICLP